MREDRVVRHICLVIALAFACAFLSAKSVAQEGWQSASSSHEFVFPRDHSAHRDKKTEWWYFVGHLESKDGTRHLGFQFTLFRQGLRGPGSPEGVSRFLVSDLHFGHLAISDLGQAKHWGHQRVLRGSFGEAGTGKVGDEKLIWVGDWSVERVGENGFHIRGGEEDVGLDLKFKSTKPVVLQGERGYSPKAAGEGNASNYYSLTRLEAAERRCWAKI